MLLSSTLGICFCERSEDVYSDGFMASQARFATIWPITADGV